MWLVKVVLGDVDSQPPAEGCHLLTSAGEFTIGRPSQGKGAKPDITVDERSISRVHAVLKVGDASSLQPGGLQIEDRSRYGTTVDGEKLSTGHTRQLGNNSTIQLAPKARIIIECVPVVICLASPPGSSSSEVVEAIAACGAQVAERFGEGVTHVLALDDAPVGWAALAAIRQGVPLVSRAWLTELGQDRMRMGGLPAAESHAPSALLLPATPPRSVPLPQILAAQQQARKPLERFTFGYSSSWQDACLEQCIGLMGGGVVRDTQAAQRGGTESAAVVVVVEASSHSGPQAGHDVGAGGLPAPTLLACLLTMDIGPVQAAAERAAAEKAAAERGVAQQDAEAAPRAATTQRLEPAQLADGAMSDDDTNMTQEAEETPQKVPPTEHTSSIQQPPQPPGPMSGWNVANKRPVEPVATQNAQAKPEQAQPAEQPQETPGRAAKRRKVANGGVVPTANGHHASTSNPAAPKHAAADPAHDFAAKAQQQTAAAAAAAAASLGAGVEQPWANLHGRDAPKLSKAKQPVAVKPPPSPEPTPKAPTPAPAQPKQLPPEPEPAADPEQNQVFNFVPLVVASMHHQGQLGQPAGGGWDEQRSASDGPPSSINYKPFRKQFCPNGGRGSSTVVPVTLVDEFPDSEDTQEFIRAEQRKRREQRQADELFNMNIPGKRR